MADISISVDFDGSSITLTSTSSAWIAAQQEIDVSGTTGSKTIAFDLNNTSGNGASFAGIRVSTSQRAVGSAPIQTDGSIRGTPLSVSMEGSTLTLTDDVSATAQRGINYYFCIGVTPTGGSPIWDDPRIYNKGGN